MFDVYFLVFSHQRHPTKRTNIVFELKISPYLDLISCDWKFVLQFCLQVKFKYIFFLFDIYGKKFQLNYCNHSSKTLCLETIESLWWKYYVYELILNWCLTHCWTVSSVHNMLFLALSTHEYCGPALKSAEEILQSAQRCLQQ